MHLIGFYYKNQKTKFRGSDSTPLLHEQESPQAMVRLIPSPEQLPVVDQTHTFNFVVLVTRSNAKANGGKPVTGPGGPIW